ncbi:anion permease [Vreelandella nigrificans]|uniref:anion permease n=1 Tax=Vreelandella nigrificans TaxID=2042704 RepID=UPI001FCB8165|nr:anion permease [Halomonas nigrificans]
MMTLTHYATGTSPVIFGSGYLTLGEWWKAGGIMSIVNLLIWVVVRGLWWKLLGHY